MNAVVNDKGAAPGGMSWAGFKALAVDTGQWIWGTAQGTFNTKATVSQIIVDAVIGMIPLLGDATAVRDLIASSMGLIDDQKKRDDKWEWVLFIVLLLALIPVLGGVVKGVGRLIISGVRSGEATAKLATDIVEVLNHLGHGNAEQWLLKLRFADYQPQIIDALNRYTATMVDGVTAIRKRMHLPESLANRLDRLGKSMRWLKDEAGKRIPDALKELDQKLREIQACIRSGGETTSRAVRYEVSAGEKAHTYTDERRVVEEGALPMRSRRGGWKQNPADAQRPKSLEPYYEPKEGYPDLAKTPDDKGQLTKIAAYSGRITNRPLAKGEKIARLFGPEDLTLGVHVGPSSAGGAWWWIGEPPANAKQWREQAAVLDEFNRDGYIVTGHVISDQGPKAAVGTVSEQVSEKIPGQYLPGGGTQAFFFLNKESSDMLSELGKNVIDTRSPVPWVDEISGIAFEIKPTGWKDANAVHGYLRLPGQGTVQTVKLGKREQASKTEEATQ
ncbi:hypothetical protein AWB80_04760 [Caballeronia pedi]|uniref:Uncharacterized protein n=1 Tax=Caballeronia pedi TaxID=1777141 RepID=A0A158C7P5_9BURK|nr:hypothetical protein [Caballeronia pedi]SAK78378.1 hypothetical protein AWB80_04760 [Caballeronia pedi]